MIHIHSLAAFKHHTKRTSVETRLTEHDSQSLGSLSLAFSRVFLSLLPARLVDFVNGEATRRRPLRLLIFHRGSATGRLFTGQFVVAGDLSLKKCAPSV